MREDYIGAGRFGRLIDDIGFSDTRSASNQHWQPRRNCGA
jgi:hypothetical protein